MKFTKYIIPILIINLGFLIEARRTLNIVNTTSQPINFCIDPVQQAYSDAPKIEAGAGNNNGKTLLCSNDRTLKPFMDTWFANLTNIAIPGKSCIQISTPSDTTYSVAFDSGSGRITRDFTSTNTSTNFIVYQFPGDPALHLFNN